MRWKDTFFLKIWNPDEPGNFGLGECALFSGLGADDVPEYEQKLAETCARLSAGEEIDLRLFPSISFGVETALADLENGGRHIPFPSRFTTGQTSVKTNGLVWMGTPQQMESRAFEKIDKGFSCIKFKISEETFDDEVRILTDIRRIYGPDILTIRLDANGAFSPCDAIDRLRILSSLDIHSIEQPIRAGMTEEMARICRLSPVPVALDEELIRIRSFEEKKELLSSIKPRYIILKPSLCGGFSGTREWIDTAESLGIGWWITSALESNIGLNAIAQWTARAGVSMPQGLGTGGLYTNNIVSPLELMGEELVFRPGAQWGIPDFNWIAP